MSKGKRVPRQVCPMALEGSYSREQLEQIGQFMCADTFNSSSASSALTVIQDKISPSAMDAYRECVSQNASGLKSKTIFREEDQGQVTLELRYVAPVGAPPQTTINNIVISPTNAFTCQGPMWDLKGQANGVGWWVCDGRTVSDPLSINYFGKALPDLSSKFLQGSAQSGSTGGAAKFKLEKGSIARLTFSFNGTPIHQDPRVSVSSSLTWVDGTPIASKGPVKDLEIPTIPPFYSVIYLIRVR